MGIDIAGDEHPKQGSTKTSSEANFTLVGKPYFSNPPNPSSGMETVKFKPGASNEDALGKLEERHQQEIKEAKERENWTDADWGADCLSQALRYCDSYSETYHIQKDGTFDSERENVTFDLLTEDGGPISLLGGLADTPEKFYQTASEIQKNHPDWHFEFEANPSAQLFKYTVTKVKPENK